MGRGPAGAAVRQLGALFTSGSATGLTDGELLERFRADHARAAEASSAAEMAFAALVSRHGGMVWGVCRRVLGDDAHEAEDAFQATFLILVRKAGSVRVEDSLGRWLYGVAQRVAIRARRQARERAGRLKQRAVGSMSDPFVAAEQAELRQILVEELERLPVKYRCAVELCHVQGMSYDQAARQLDWPVATVKSRLTRGRSRLRERLARRGVAPGMAVMSLGGGVGVPQALVHATVRASALSGRGAVPAAVMVLTEGTIKTMIWKKIQLAAAGSCLVIGLVGQVVSTSVGGTRVAAERSEQEAVKKSEPAVAKVFDRRRWTRHLANRATIEVVGISAYPNGAETWWRPDGSPLRPAPCDAFKSNVSADGVSKSVLVRVSDVPEGADFKWSMPECRGSSSVSPVFQGGKPVAGLRGATFVVDAGAMTGTVRFEVADGPWKTVVSCGMGYVGMGTQAGGFIFDSGKTEKGGTTLTVTLAPKGGDAERLIAVDVDGKEHVGGVFQGMGAGDIWQTKAEFAIPPKRIREFRYQTRPFEEAEVRDVALEPVK